MERQSFIRPIRWEHADRITSSVSERSGSIEIRYASDLGAGDMFVYGDLSEKVAKESLARERLSGLLPAEVASEVSDTWREFEKGESIEAKYVDALDRLLPLYSNYLNSGFSLKNHGITVDRVVAKNESPIQNGLEPLWGVARKLIDEAVSDGNLGR